MVNGWLLAVYEHAYHQIPCELDPESGCIYPAHAHFAQKNGGGAQPVFYRFCRNLPCGLPEMPAPRLPVAAGAARQGYRLLRQPPVRFEAPAAYAGAGCQPRPAAVPGEPLPERLKAGAWCA
jgi:hypothetical protein